MTASVARTVAPLGQTGFMTDIELVASPVTWSGVAVVPSSADSITATDRLPLQGHDPYERLAAAFLAGYPKHSARAYAGDLRAWWSWCSSAGVHPFDARRHHVDAWVRTLSSEPLPRTAKPMGAASIRRRLSAVSKLYKYAIQAGVLTVSPVEHVKRPTASDETASVGLSPAELNALLDRAAAAGPRWEALVTLLAYNGLRIDEALGADVEDYRFQRGHRVLRIVRKGGKTSMQPLAPPTVRALDTYLESAGHPENGPLFLGRSGQRLPYRTAYANVGRLAKAAGIPSADLISPHSLRHTFVTEALAAGVPLQDVQDAAGHKDPATTRRYDRTRLSHDRHPTYVLAAHLGRSDGTTASND